MVRQGQSSVRPAIRIALCAVLWQGASAAYADEQLCLRTEAPRPAVRQAFISKAMNVSALAALRGGAQLSVANLTGAVDGNSAVNTISGNNTIGTGAFSNSNGLPVVIQNSGNNVLIQNSTIVNVQIK